MLDIGIKIRIAIDFSYRILLIKEIWLEKILLRKKIKNLSKESKNRNIWDYFKFYLNHFK